jgi:plasmid stabilization system protein ParE
VTYKVEIHPDALADIEAVAAWYESQQSGLGADFVRAVRQAINGLAANPLIYCVRERKRQVRWFFPPRFPYRIVYRVKEDVITVLVVLHAARHDRRWRERLS